ncbi:PI-PLC X domain-containing protein At5g67130 [Musa acuminata AAA Group]|uniref:PI-PLC X domain-containing protein At5g67130 n=1 Tax=Musa acuminata AAA Group TaxID=214697 RepID=UPI0031DDD942
MLLMMMGSLRALRHLVTSLPLLLLLPLLLCLLSSFSSAAELGETCLFNSDCDPGLHCETCLANGNFRLRCTRVKPKSPIAEGVGLPFNKYAWLTTHNSFALLGAPSFTGKQNVAEKNQQDSVTEQLEHGVRGLMLDMYDYDSDIWLCHSYEGKCFDALAFQPAVNVLGEIRDFLEANPSEIITIFIEDYVSSPMGLTKVFNASGLLKYWFPVSSMPKNGEDWPLVSEMITQNQRLVVFTSEKTKEASEGIAYQWRYVVENQYGDGGMEDGSCPNRAESLPMHTTSRSLVLMNYFPSIPYFFTACKHNSGPLESMLNTCYSASANRWANFIAVDYYRRSDGGGASQVTDLANDRMLSS